MIPRSPRGPRSLTLVALVASLAVVAAACAGDGPAERTSGERATTTTGPTGSVGELGGWTVAPLEWTPCDDLAEDAECATLAVPLAWSDPEGPTIELALGRLPATATSEGSVVVNPGGPGGSGLDFLAADPLSDAVTARFDTVSWDPRGIGRSTAVRCGDDVGDFYALDADPDTPEEQVDLERAAADISSECAARDADLLPNLGTADVARDLEAIRVALGADPLNFVGFSYGTAIGQQYARLYPNEIRTMVLDGVVDPAQGFTEFLTAQARAFESAFEANARACARAGEAACGVADLGESYDRVKAEAEAAPIPAGRDEVGPSQVATAAVFTTYLTDGWRELGPALALAEDGDATSLLELARSYYDFGGYGGYAAVTCIDTPPPLGAEAYRAFAEQAAAAAPRFGAGVANEMLPCATWPAPPVGRPEVVVAEGAPPILVVGNTGDPATPYANAVAVADRLASGVLLTVEMDGHTAYGTNRCATRAVDAYLLELRVPEPGTVCR